jgi:predicted ArsR family transcriptional regulator
MLHRKTKGKDEWTKLLMQTLTKNVDVIPPGWLTSDQVAKKFGVQRSQAIKLLKDMREDGLVEAKQFRVVINKEYGVARPQVHYRIKK